MRLIELSANQSTFKTVSFKRQGLNIICGAKNNPSDTSTNKTFNGVGKSLLMNIVNFCLGSNKIEQFESKIPDWVFTLKFEVDGKMHIVKRSTKQQSKINLNGKEVILKVYKKHLEELCFGNSLEISDLSFRTLIYRFLRLDKKSSQLWNDFSPDKNEYHKLLRTGFLLGLDPEIIAKKKELRSEYKKIEDDRDRLEKDEVFKKFFLEGEDVEIEISSLKEKVEKKEKVENILTPKKSDPQKVESLLDVKNIKENDEKRVSKGGLPSNPVSPPSTPSHPQQQIGKLSPLANNLSIDEEITKNNLKYNLYAIFIHKGTAYAGHYYIYIKSFETNLWYLFDDSQVTEVNLVNVMRDAIGGGMTPANAYMLAYRKAENKEVVKIESKIELENENKIQTGGNTGTMNETLSLGHVESSRTKTDNQNTGWDYNLKRIFLI